MSDEPIRKSRSRTPLQFFIVVACIFVGYIISVMTTDLLRSRAGQSWSDEFARINVTAHLTGYEDRSASIFGSVPILGEILTHRSALNIFVDDPAELQPALDMATKCSMVERVWINLHVFDRAIEADIHKKLPGMKVQFYTP